MFTLSHCLSNSRQGRCRCTQTETLFWIFLSCEYFSENFSLEWILPLKSFGLIVDINHFFNHTLVLPNQVYNILIQMYGTMTCVNRIVCFLTHQIGLTTSSSSLLILVTAFYKHMVSTSKVCMRVFVLRRK